MPTMHPVDYTAEALEDETGIDPRLSAPLAVEVAGLVRVEEHPPHVFTTDQVAVGTAPTRLVSAHAQRAHVTMVARGGDVFIGGAGVTLGTGFILPDGAGLSLEVRAAIYAVAATAGAAVVHVLAQHREG